MATKMSGVDWKSAPEDYAALHRIYFPFMVNLVAKNGIDENNKEDVASEILLRLIEKRFLEQFDPDMVFEYQGEKRPARFKSFLARAVTVYARGHYDKQKRTARREVQICDLQMGDETTHHFGQGEQRGSSWADLFGEATTDHSDDVIELVADEQDATYIRAWLANRPPRSSSDICDLVAVYDAVRAQLLTFGEYDVKALQEQFGCSTSAMYGWLWWLRANLAEAYGRPCPPKRPRIVKKRIKR